MPYVFNPFSGSLDNAPSTFKGDSAYTTVQSASTNWDNTYSTVQTNSSTNWDNALANQYAHANFLPLTGGIITGTMRFNDDVTIFGDLSCTGTQTFANTIFTTTSAVSVVHFGSGPAMWVGNNGDGDIASFYDTDQGIEVLHVGGINGDFPNVGIKTSTPNKDFTVNGEISAFNTIWAKDNNSDQWTSVYSTVQSNSASSWNTSYFLPLSGGTMTGKLIASADSSFSKLNIGGSIASGAPTTTVDGDLWITNQNRLAYKSSGNVINLAGLSQQNIFSQPQSIGSTSNAAAVFTVNNTGSREAATFVAQGTSPAVRITQNGTGNALTVEDSTNPDATPFIVDALGSVGIGLSSLSGFDTKLTVVGTISSTSIIYASGGDSDIWNSTYSTVQANSASWITDSTTDVGVRALTSFWDSTYTTVYSNSANWDYQGTDLKNLSSGWVGGNDAYTNLVVNSAAYLSGYDLSFLSVSANWNSTYTTVSSNSANWQSTYTNYSTNSALYIKTVSTNTAGTSAISTIVAVSAIPVVQTAGTLYILI